MKRYCDEFIKFTDRAMSAYHSVAAVKEALDKEGYEAVPFSGKLSLKKGGSYYMDIYGTTLIAFTVGKKPEGRLHIAAAHTDYPCLK
ncbi:MAG: M18 family aminopeptidase, partial [Lachnospiraceae bacterium]|nr:M18 family aminopeptidase [Lachnospiraceae bacterium]